MPDKQPQKEPETSHGREVEHPQQIPARGWKDVAVRVWGSIGENNLFLVAGGVTYSVILALFPALAALISIYGLLFNPEQVEQQVNSLAGVLPGETLKLISDQLHQLTSASNGALGFGAIVGILFALWTASRGMSGLITALDIAYEQPETRSFIRFNLVALGLTLVMLVGGVVVIALVAGLPAFVRGIGMGGFLRWVSYVIEWPLLIVCIMFGMAVLYRYGPNRTEARWQWVTPGAFVGTALWILGSVLFTVYVAHFNSYNKTYGSLGGVVILLTWLYLSSFVLLLGAAVNAESERQTRRDTTEGGSKPMGQRGAHAADTLGPTSG